MISIAIDGPSGSGKSTIAKRLAKKLNFLNVDTGALYRAIAYFLCTNNLDFENELVVRKNLPKINLDIKHREYSQKIFLNGEDITKNIRSQNVSKISSIISSMPSVRSYLLDIQKKLAQTNNVIMDGRDIGTIVLPNADVKIFLTASSEVRAQRRYEQLLATNETVKYNDVLDSINQRDFNDRNRTISPLKCPEDAVIFDSSRYTLDETTEILLNIIEERVLFESKQKNV